MIIRDKDGTERIATASDFQDATIRFTPAGTAILRGVPRHSRSVPGRHRNNGHKGHNADHVVLRKLYIPAATPPYHPPENFFRDMGVASR